MRDCGCDEIPLPGGNYIKFYDVTKYDSDLREGDFRFLDYYFRLYILGRVRNSNTANFNKTLN